MMSSEEMLRATVAALLSRTGERQAELAAGIGLSPTGLSRRQSGRATWSLEDVDRLSAHWGIAVPDLLGGISHAVECLPADRLPTSAQATTSAPKASAAGQLPLPAGPEESPKVSPAPPDTEPDTPPAPAPEQQPATAPATATATAPAPAPAPAPVPVAALPAAPVGAPVVAAPDPGQAGTPEPCVLCGKGTTARAAGQPQHMYGLCVGGQLPTTLAPQTPPAPAPAPAASAVTDAGTPPAPSPSPPRRTAGYAEGDLGTTITATVARVLREHDGDTDAARAALVKRAIPDVMALFAQSRATGRYEHKDFPPTEDILKKRTQKGADAIWEGRPKWHNTTLVAAVKAGDHAALDITALDANAAYLSAWKTRLPLGRLVHDTSGLHDPKKAGVHLIIPPAWDHTDLPSPLGARMEPGDLWVTEPTLRLLQRCAKDGLCEAPVIRESYVSGSTEGLLEKLRRTLAEARATAIATDDTLTVEYIKAMYSKFVSTIGESSTNREIRRPDWMHIIRSQAFANLWLKAHKARTGGLTVVQMSGTDELHIAGDWKTVFAEGRGLADMKTKETYTLGGKP
ncbi:acyltransferase [Streptomyces sp. NBC_01775]|uniref:acyltransferase n=1 Tax=Streptomyces sp. NBC_01775 TaxID=2975939 RepID=UPI002DD96E56|nr:acyltransferase [Streptomyces sp. NBC_01775]WSB74335.1 acyltransferase [Streptomyces sp. NBC_01775]WSB81312.1 acyltransferase [Streptomyces sp. NBC_01775]